jgi:hypothetical protein
MSWDTLSPYEIPALREYLIPYLGKDFVDEIVAYANRSAEDDEVLTMEDCLQRFRLATSGYMMLDAFCDQNVQLTDLGPQQQSSSEGGSAQPSQWAYKNKVWHMMKKADKYTDQLLDFVEEQARPQVPEGGGDPVVSTEFASFAEDIVRRRQTSDFFGSTTEVDEHLNIEGSRRAWAKMVPYFRDAEWRYLRPVLGDAFYLELSESYASGISLSTTHDAVIKLIQRAGAKFGLLLSIPNLACVIDGDGIMIVSRRDGFDERVSSGSSNNQAAISRLQQSAEGQGRTALAELRSYIIAEAENLTTYLNSTAYPTASETNLPIGETESGAIFL